MEKAKRTKIELDVKVVECKAYDDQKPGTSGLRKRTRKFMEGTYLNNFVASVRSVGEALTGSTLVVEWRRSILQPPKR